MQRQVQILIGLLFVFGSIYPHYSVSGLPAADGLKADAVFVLAGGENRIVAGLNALKERKADQLFILGTGHLAAPGMIVPGFSELSEGSKRKIHLEGWSETTLENAVSAKSIVAEHRFRRVLLVTSDYHMPRAYLALRHAIPESVHIAALPVRSAWKGTDARWRKTKLFFFEAWKYWGYRLLLRWE